MLVQSLRVWVQGHFLRAFTLQLVPVAPVSEVVRLIVVILATIDESITIVVVEPHFVRDKDLV